MIIVPIISLYNPQDQTILLSIRPTGKQLAGYYEFPGGKTEAGELPSAALCREMFEELGILVSESDLTPVTFTNFYYQDKGYLLLMYFCTTYQNEPYGKEGQVIEWVSCDRLRDYKMPEFNTYLIPELERFIKQVDRL